MNLYKWAGDHLGRFSAIAWAWTLLPGTVLASIVSWWARVDALPLWLRAVVFVGVLTLVAVILAAFRVMRSVTITGMEFADLKRRVRDEHLATLQGKADAERQFHFDEGVRSMGGGHIVETIGRAAEMSKARHRGNVARAERGEE